MITLIPYTYTNFLGTVEGFIPAESLPTWQQRQAAVAQTIASRGSEARSAYETRLGDMDVVKSTMKTIEKRGWQIILRDTAAEMVAAGKAVIVTTEGA